MDYDSESNRRSRDMVSNENSRTLPEPVQTVYMWSIDGKGNVVNYPPKASTLEHTSREIFYSLTFSTMSPFVSATGPIK